MKKLIAALLCLTAFNVFADEKSEKAAADLLHRRLANEKPEEAALLKSVQGKDIVVVAGEMDHIESVLRATGVPFTLIQPSQVADFKLKANMAVMVNCPGTMPDAGVQRIARFVRAGGLLYTTDWALQSVIEKAFPGTIAANGEMTASEVVPVSIDKSSDNLMSSVLLRKASQPQWWLEGGSFPIKILDPKKVEVLASSPQMAKSYGAGPVVVRFRWEDGEVVHVVSHFYRQLDAQGPAVAAAQAVNTFEGLSDADRREFAKSEGSGTSVGNVESSYAFQRMTSNLLTGKQKRNEELDRAYGFTSTTPLALPSAPARPAKEAKLRVLERKKDKTLVRDDEGNEGWVDSASLIAR